VNESKRILVSSYLPVAGREITQPIEEELESLYQINVQSRTSDGEPAAAGMSEIAITITVAAGGALAMEFFKPLVTHAGKAFRDWMLEALSKARKSKVQDRIYIPLLFEFGEESTDAYPTASVRYFFYGRMDEEELLRRLQVADEHINSLPEELFSGSGGPTENGFYWDKQQGLWRGNVWRYPEPSFGEFWLAPGRWDEGFEDEDEQISSDMS
jgi:hypothetical protein